MVGGQREAVAERGTEVGRERIRKRQGERARQKER